MSTITRRKRVSQRELGAFKRYELLTGERGSAVPEFYTGYTDGFDDNVGNFISDDMRADWEANRDELMAFWNSGKYLWDVYHVPDSLPHLVVIGRRGTLPWAAKQFDRGGGGRGKRELHATRGPERPHHHVDREILSLPERS